MNCALDVSRVETSAPYSPANSFGHNSLSIVALGSRSFIASVKSRHESCPQA